MTELRRNRATADPAEIVDWIDQRLDEMLAQPRLWATTTESLEFQALALLEVRGLLLGEKPTGPADGGWRTMFTMTAVGAGYVSERYRDAPVDDPSFVQSLRAGLRTTVRKQDEGRADGR